MKDTNTTTERKAFTNNLNELSSASRSGTPTVAGSVSAAVLSITVSGTGLSSGPATLYSDKTWVRQGASPADGANSYSASALDSLGRQDSTTVNAYLPAAPNYVYDENGNLLSDGRRGFAYDDENQLISITVTNSWQSRFLYDGKMRRRVRIECTWNGSAWQTNDLIRYIYDGNLVIQERNNGSTPLVTYTRGTDLSSTFEGAGGIGGLLARTANPLLNIGDPTAHAYYSADGNGNITCLVNTNGAFVAKYLYDPFGNILAQSGSLAEANLYRFSSKELHANSGLVYYLYRFYEPTFQKWINMDLVAGAAARNLYEFLHNDPVALIDPLGLDAIGSALTLWQECQYYRCMYAMWKQRNTIRSRAIREAQERFGGYGVDGGPQDTFRHCLAGCYLAKAMRETPECATVAPESFIREEELKRSSNKSQTDIDNGIIGAQAPKDADCQSYCIKAMAEGRAKNEKPGPWPIAR